MIQKNGSANWKTEYENHPRWTKKEKRIFKNEDSLKDPWDNKHTHICIIGVPEEEKEKGADNLFKEIIAENFPNQGKETDF